MQVTLRPLHVDDLDALAVFESDPAANALAATVARGREEFIATWSRSLGGETVAARAILADGCLVGRINAFPVGDERHVGYWIARSHWGRGVGTRALALFLHEVPHRPLHAVVAADNQGSLRLLERNGFRRVGERDAPATERYLACREVLLTLDAPAST